MGDKRDFASYAADGEQLLWTAYRRIVAKIPFLFLRKVDEGDLLNLCRRCRELDLNGIFNGPSPSTTSEKVLSLGILDKQSACALCRFFYSIRRPSSTVESISDSYHLRKYRFDRFFVGRESEGSTLWAVTQDSRSEGHEMRLCSLNACPWDHVVISPPMSDRPELMFLPQSTKPCPYPEETLKGLPVYETSVNYPLLRHWIKECEGHPNCSYLSSDLTKSHTGPTIRGIDCTTRNIVDLQPGVKYIALSYVWGNKPLPENKGKSSNLHSSQRALPTIAPKVVEDAMIVVKELGQRYLWVDQYCIDQHDQQDKHAQIRNMDRIYEGSHATIVAFSGVDSSSGLPGVGTPRIPRPRFTSSKMTLLGFTPSISRQTFDASVWMKRGWTFQEALLSRRLLIFTQEQVYFHCSFGWWVESCTPRPRMMCEFNTGNGIGFCASWNAFLPLPLGCHDVSYPTRQAMQSFSPLIRLPSQKSGSQVQVDVDRLLELISRFTGRQLSFQLDALDAVRGLLSRVGVLTYWGIPVYELPEGLGDGGTFTISDLDVIALFLQRLLWVPIHAPTIKHLEYLGRREGFPSWSWLGWRMPVGFNPELSFHLHGSTIRYMAQSTVMIEEESGILLSLPDLIKLWAAESAEIERSRILPERTTYVWVEGLVFTLGFQPDSNRHNGEICFCINHPLGYADDPCEMKNSCRPSDYSINKAQVQNPVCFRFDVRGSEDTWERTLKRKWDCLLIFSTSERRGSHHFLILDEGDDAACCVGTLFFVDHTREGNLLEKLMTQVPCSERMVRLG